MQLQNATERKVIDYTKMCHFHQRTFVIVARGNWTDTLVRDTSLLTSVEMEVERQAQVQACRVDYRILSFRKKKKVFVF